jgi:adenine-specific DNA-methyltransferase
MENLISDSRIWWGKDGGNMPRLKVYRSEVDDGIVPSTWWTREFAGDNQDAKREIRELFPEADIFSTPKPTQLIAQIIGVSIESDDLIVDFFAGSGTTGHSTMLRNAGDGGKRRFIIVQLPEQLAPDNSEQKAAATFCDSIKKPRTISELTKERLRRAGKKVKKDNPMFTGDIGFRVFKLDTSNIRTWDPKPENVAQQVIDSTIHIKPDRSDEDILTELLLKLGIELTVQMESKTIAKKQVHSVGAGTLIVCLEKSITKKEAEPLALGIAKWHKELAPAGESTIVFRDSAFEDDVAKSNLAAILQQHGLTNVRSL